MGAIELVGGDEPGIGRGSDSGCEAVLSLAEHPGCWNMPRKPNYGVPVRRYSLANGDLMHGTIIRTVVDVSSRDCRYDGRANDRRCDGCFK